MGRARKCIALVFAGLAWMIAPAVSAQTEFQPLSFPEPGWYFVSLQVDPVDPDPLAVFPVVGGFEYDHLWSYDPDAGWRHFSPAFAPNPTLDTFNDLTDIEALRGYWIRVVRVPSSSFVLMVEGEPVAIQRLTGAGWHAIGPLLPVSAGPVNVQGVFQALGPALPLTISEAWGYDGSRDELTALLPLDADCGSAPATCLSPGSGYWIYTTGDLALGIDFELEPPGLLITPEAPLQRLVLSYTGSGSAVGTLRPSVPGSGLRFRAARISFVDGLPLAEPEPDPDGGDPNGPDTQVDLDGDTTLDPCPDTCASAPDCLNLCFADPTRTHTVYVELEPQTLFALETFTSLDPGLEFATLELDLSVGASSGALSGLPVPGNVVASIPVAVRPPLLIGEWAGSLFYDGALGREVPIRLWIDDCIETPGGGPQSRDCGSQRLTGIINPTIVGSISNAFDDDGDGDVDEPDEQGAEFRTGEAPAFPADVVLHGSAPSGNELIRLTGSASIGAALPEVAAVTCVGGVCEDGSGSCSQDEECPRNAGLGLFFGQTVRTLELEGVRTGADTMGGTFVDRFESVGLGEASDFDSGGRLSLQRVAAPQCVARDPGSGDSLALDVACRVDTDCPRRCAGGHPSLDGFSCIDNGDCVAELVGGQQINATCQPFTCAFAAFGGSSATALEHSPVALPLAITGTFEFLSIEILAEERFVLARPGDLPAIDLGILPCGPADIRISGNNCAPVVATVPDLCSPTFPPITCSGSPTTPIADAPGGSGGPLQLVSGFPVTGAATFQLDNPSPDCASCVARWEDSSGTPVPATLSDGALVQLLGLGASDVVVAPAALGTFTDFLSWPPIDGLRAGLLHFFIPPGGSSSSLGGGQAAEQ